MVTRWDRGLSLCLTVTAILGYNGLFHYIATLHMRRSTPGVITGLLPYIPLTLSGNWCFFTTDAVLLETAVLSLALGSPCQVLYYGKHRPSAAAATRIEAR